MAENQKLSASTMIGLGMVGLGGFGLWAITDWLGKREETRQYLNEIIFTEMQELDQYQAEIARKGELTQEMNDTLSNMEAEINWKQEEAAKQGQGFLDDITENLMKWLAGIGLFIILTPPAKKLTTQGPTWAGQVLKHLFRRRPVKNPEFRDPMDQKVFADEVALRYHQLTTHSVTTDSTAILSAQAIYKKQPYWVREVIATEAKVYGRAGAAWTSLTQQEQFDLAYGMTYATSIAIVAESLGPAVLLLFLIP